MDCAVAVHTEMEMRESYLKRAWLTLCLDALFSRRQGDHRLSSKYAVFVANGLMRHPWASLAKSSAPQVGAQEREWGILGVQFRSSCLKVAELKQNGDGTLVGTCSVCGAFSSGRDSLLHTAGSMLCRTASSLSSGSSPLKIILPKPGMSGLWR